MRSLLTALAVSVAVLTVLTLGIVTDSIQGALSEQQLGQIGKIDGVQSAIGVLLDTEKLDENHPLLVEIGDLLDFGRATSASSSSVRRIEPPPSSPSSPSLSARSSS